MYGTTNLNRRSDWYRRPETLQTSSHREDQQPNETIVKRRVVAPPTILSTSAPEPHSYFGQGMDISWKGRGHSSRGGWTQVAKRGKKRGQGGYGLGRGGGWRRNDTAQSHSTFNLPGSSASPSFPPEQAQPPFMTKSLVSEQSCSPSEVPIIREDAPMSSIRQSEAYAPEPGRFRHPLPTRPRSQGISTPVLPTPKEPPHISPPPCVSPPRPLTPCKSPTPPLKRRRIDHKPDLHPSIKTEDIEGIGNLFVAVPPPVPSIKREEQTPTPLAPPERRLVTESCSFFPLPDNCHKGNPDYKQNRRALFGREYNILKSLGLQKTKVLFREDGMVIEWTSPIPVWSDTLRPEPSNLSAMIEAASRANSRSSAPRHKSITPKRSPSHDIDKYLSKDADRLSPPMRPPSSQRDQLSQRPLSSSITPLPRRRPLPLPVPLAKPKSVTKSNHPTNFPIAGTIFIPETPAEKLGLSQAPQPATRGTLKRSWAADLAKVEPLAISYLQRYIQIFDTDRPHLQGGYADDAILSVRISRSAEAMRSEGTLYQSDSRFVQGSGPICDTLASLGPQKFCPHGVAGKVLYDVVSLNSEAGGGILLTVHGEVVSEPPDSGPYSHQTTSNTFTLTQSFILQRKRNRGGAELWPLQATSHQMVLRQISSMGPGLLSVVEMASPEDEFPWLP